MAYTIFIFIGKNNSLSTYEIALFTISLSLLLCFNLRTNYVFGNDINLELYEFNLTYESTRWIPSTLYSSCLSITILPTMISAATGISGELLFKLMYPFILSFIPIILFSIYRKWLGNSLSFGVSMFMIASAIYLLHMPSLARQIVSLFLLVLAFYFLINYKQPSRLRNFIIIFLSFGVIVSHYSTGLIYIGILFLLAFYPYMLQLVLKIRRRPYIHRGFAMVPLYLFLVVFCLGLIWYRLTQVPLNYAIFSIQEIIFRFNDIWNLSSRSSDALQLVGVAARQGLPNIMGYWIGNVIRGLILVGLLVCLFKSSLGGRFKIRYEFVLLGSISILALFSALVIPYVTTLFNLDRLYLTFLIFMLPFLGVGIFFLSRYIHRLGLPTRKSVKIFLSFILIAQMLFSTGLLNQLTGYSSFVVLNDFDTATKYNDLSPDSRYYIFDEEVASIKWMVNFITSINLEHVVSDHIGRLAMSGYGSIPYKRDYLLNINGSNYLDLPGSYLYFRYENSRYNKIYDGEYFQIENVTAELSKYNRIYDNSISQLYLVP